MNDLLNLTENTVHTARFGHDTGPASIRQSYANSRPEFGDSHTSPPGWQAEKRDHFVPVRLVVGTVGLCSKSDPEAIRTGSKALHPCQVNC